MWRLGDSGYPELHDGQRCLMPTIVNPDNVSELVTILLSLADDRRDVKTSTDYNRLSLVVPDYLYERWEKYTALESSPPKEPKKSGSKK